MAVTDIDLDQILATVAEAAPEAEPLDRLAAAQSTSAWLQTISHHLVAHHVDQARRAGASWTDIGAALGVTRQAAQQRFVPAAATDLEAAKRKVLLPLSARTESILDGARTLATENHHRTIEDVHLLLALLDSRASGAMAAVKALGHKAADVRKPARARLGSTGSRRGAKKPLLGRSALTALQVGTREALRLGRPQVGSEHLLLGLAADPSSAAGQALNDAVVDTDALRSEVAKRPDPN